MALGTSQAIPEELAGLVLSNPFAELAVNNAKYIKACTELHLAGKEIQALWGFDRFVNLEVLWVNNNKLTAIENLDANFRIKRLYAHHNAITTLEGSLPCFTFLEVLYLSYNSLSNLSVVLEHLCDFHYLHELELQGNPVAEEPNYRLRVIHTLPSLHVLDRHVVTDEERRAAAARFGKKPASTSTDPAGATAKRTQKLSATGQVQKQPLSVCERDLATEVKRIKEERKAAEAAELEAAYAAGRRTPLDTTRPVPSAIMSLASPESKSDSSGTLSEWELYVWRKALKTADKGRTGKLPKPEFERLVVELEDSGARCLDLVDPDTKDKYLAAMEPAKDGNISISAFIAAAQGSLEDPATGTKLPRLRFESLSSKECATRSEAAYKQAADIQARLLQMPADDPRRPKLTQQAFQLSEKGARLSNLAQTMAVPPAMRTGLIDTTVGRGDYVTFLSTVTLHKDAKKNATITPEDSGSDSDTDDEDGKVADPKYDTYRIRRKARKPRQVIATGVRVV